jgi:hypothetical protein
VAIRIFLVDLEHPRSSCRAPGWLHYHLDIDVADPFEFTDDLAAIALRS